MRYGFRVFKMTTHLNGRGSAVEWSDEVIAELLGVLFDLQRSGTMKGTPFIRRRRAELAEADEEAPRFEEMPPSATFLATTLVNPRHLHVLLNFGRYGTHRDLHRADGASDDISDAAPGSRHRIDVFFPEEGDTALAVVETVATHPSPQGVFQAHIASRARSLAADPNDTRKYLRSWHGARLNGHPDGAKLRALIDEAQSATAVFKDTTTTSRGRRKPVDKQLSLNLKDAGRRDTAVQNADRWLDLINDEELSGADRREQEAQAVNDMIDEFGLDREALDALSLDFDDVALVIKDARGKERLFTPAAVRMMFTYPVAPAEPRPEVYYEAVSDRVQNLVAQYGYEIAPIKMGEVLDACRTDSTQGRFSVEQSEQSDTDPQ